MTLWHVKNVGKTRDWTSPEDYWLKNITIRIFFLFMHVRFVTLCFSGFSSKFCIAAIQSIGRKTRDDLISALLQSIMTLEVMTSISGIFCCFWDWVSKNLLHVSRWLHENTGKQAGEYQQQRRIIGAPVNLMTVPSWPCSISSFNTTLVICKYWSNPTVLKELSISNL